MKFCFLLLLLICFSATAQELPITTQQQLENLADENLEDDALLQQLDFYRKHPLNLNSASKDELTALRFLNDLQISSLMRYRLLFGKLIDIYELQAVPGFDVPTIKKIQPYIYAGDALNLKDSFLSRLRGGDQYALLRLSEIVEKAKGYNTTLPTHYAGSRLQAQFRYRYQYKNLLYYGLIGDKDAGEQFFKGAQKLGFDFYSVHLFARNLGKFKAIALGDYVVNLGQGLTQWQSLGFGKSAEVMNIKRQSPVLLPYRAAGEFNFNRGAAATVQFRNIEVTGFISYKKFSGNLITDSVDKFSAFGTSGYYRTQSEIADRYKLTDFSAGGNLAYEKNSVKLGFNAVVHHFSLPLQKTLRPYNYYALSGKTAFNASVDYSFTSRNAHFFGELAVDRNLQRSFIQGVIISLDQRMDFSVLYRNLGKSYQSLFGNAVTENTLPTNEQGFYLGTTIRPTLNWQLTAYADHYSFPFLKYRVAAPSRGWDYLGQISFSPKKNTEIYLRYRTENKPINETGNTAALNFPSDKVKQSLRLHVSTLLNDKFSLQGRTELVWFDKKGHTPEEGFLMYLEGGFRYSSKLKANIRLQYFETGGYNSRIYTYETDVLYSFSIPSFFDKGARYYININGDISKRLSLWLRFAQTIYKDKDWVGSGLDRINGNRKSEVKVEMKYNF